MYKNGFTIVELIVVMVIVAVLWGVWFNAFSNYVAEANLTKYEDQFIALKNKLPAKFAKSFNDNWVVFDLENWNTNWSLYWAPLAPAVLTSGTLNALNWLPVTLPSTIDLNGELIKIIDIVSFDSTLAVSDTVFANSSMTRLLLVNDRTDWVVNWTLFFKIQDDTVCNSRAFMEKVNTSSIRYAGWWSNWCFISSTHQGIPLKIK